MSVTSISDELNSLKACAIDLLIGELLGSGATRRTYALRNDPHLVIKLEHAKGEFCNVAEYEIWKAVKGHENAKWFAPVISIDTWAGALIMRRTKPITQQEFEAEVHELPAFFDDFHWANFGRLDGRIVCHDYGYHRLMEGVKSRRVRRLSHASKVAA